MREAWASALRSTSDVKELIPQVGIAPISHDAVHELYSTTPHLYPRLAPDSDVTERIPQAVEYKSATVPPMTWSITSTHA